MSSSLVFPVPADESEHQNWYPIVYEVEGHTQPDCHYGFPGLFHLLQFSIDAHVGGINIVRDSRKFLF